MRLALPAGDRGDAPQPVTIRWSDLHLAGKPSTVRDLWKHADVAPSQDGYTASVPMHGVVLLNVLPSK